MRPLGWGDWLVTVTSLVRECTEFCADRIDTEKMKQMYAFRLLEEVLKRKWIPHITFDIDMRISVCPNALSAKSGERRNR